MSLQPRSGATKQNLGPWPASPVVAGAIERMQPEAERGKPPGFSLHSALQLHQSLPMPRPNQEPVGRRGQERQQQESVPRNPEQSRGRARRGPRGNGSETRPSLHVITTRINEASYSRIHHKPSYIVSFQ